ASRYAFPAKRITPASPHKPAFVYRWGAENERQNSHAGPPAQPAFVYRWGAENERQNGRGGSRGGRPAGSVARDSALPSAGGDHRAPGGRGLADQGRRQRARPPPASASWWAKATSARSSG